MDKQSDMKKKMEESTGKDKKHLKPKNSEHGMPQRQKGRRKSGKRRQHHLVPVLLGSVEDETTTKMTVVLARSSAKRV